MCEAYTRRLGTSRLCFREIQDDDSNASTCNRNCEKVSLPVHHDFAQLGYAMVKVDLMTWLELDLSTKWYQIISCVLSAFPFHSMFYIS